MLDVPQRPSWGASAELPELGLGFYLNGLINNMSALNTGDAAPTNLGGMVVLDLQNQTVNPRRPNLHDSIPEENEGGLTDEAVRRPKTFPLIPSPTRREYAVAWRLFPGSGLEACWCRLGERRASGILCDQVGTLFTPSPF